MVFITKKNFILYDKKELLDELPPKLRSDIAMQMYNGVIKKIKFFDDKDNNFIGQVVPLLSTLSVSKYDFIFKKGNYPN